MLTEVTSLCVRLPPVTISVLTDLPKFQVSLPKYFDRHSAVTWGLCVASTRGLLYEHRLIFTVHVHLVVLTVEVLSLSLTGYSLVIECDLCDI